MPKSLWMPGVQRSSRQWRSTSYVHVLTLAWLAILTSSSACLSLSSSIAFSLSSSSRVAFSRANLSRSALQRKTSNQQQRTESEQDTIQYTITATMSINSHEKAQTNRPLQLSLAKSKATPDSITTTPCQLHQLKMQNDNNHTTGFGTFEIQVVLHVFVYYDCV